jgi:DNA-binding CsgD family transcriptional regulator
MIKLSKRQKQLLVLLDQGLSNRGIATELCISEHTVKVHLWRMFRRLNVNSRLEAARWGRDNDKGDQSASQVMLAALQLALPVLLAARQQWPRSPFDDSIDVVEQVRAAIALGAQP